MRLSRPCYDKPDRCPGWAGGGWKFGKKDQCENGSIRTWTRTHLIREYWVKDLNGYPGEHRWRFGHCTKCDVITWPYNIRFIDPTTYTSKFQMWPRPQRQK